MTTFGPFDLEHSMDRALVDLPTFEVFNAQYQLPTAMMYCGAELARHHDVPLQHAGSLSANCSTSLDSDRGQGLAQSSETGSYDSVAKSPPFWEHDIAPAVNFDYAHCTPIAADSTAGIPTSVFQWNAFHTQPAESHSQAACLVGLPRHLDPIQTSTCPTNEMSNLIAGQVPPHVPHIPNQGVSLSPRHLAISHPPIPRMGGLQNPSVTIHKFAAHQPIPPECQSTYSTLTGNIEFLEKLRLESCSRTPTANRTSCFQTMRSHPPLPATPPTSSNKCQTSPLPGTPSCSKSQEGPMHIPAQSVSTDVYSSGGTSSAKRARTEDQSVWPSSASLSQPPPLNSLTQTPTSDLTPQPSSALTIEEAPPATKRAKNVKEPRKPSLACLFCRERKIGCGRPPEGSEDMTCNQCARRKFVCVYMTEKPPRVRRRSAKAKSPTA